MSEPFANVEPMIYQSRISVPYSWWAGDTASRFFVSLRDERKILGTKCSGCSKVYLPPRKVCPTCFTENTDWVEVSDKGVLQSFTIARRQLAALGKSVPVIFGLIKLDGSDTSLLHYVDEVSEGEVKIGMRLEARFADERKGGILDIAHFHPVK
jgi:uncharacterized OB-fold protein